MNPHDVVNGDEHFALLLACYNQAMKGGGADPKADGALSPELRQRLQRDLNCLRRLQRFPIPSDLRTLPYNESAPDTVVLPAGITLHDGAACGQVGRFRLLRTLDQGGGGIVFLAYDPVLRRQAAVKIPRLDALLDSELRRRFLREARAAAGLNHPNLLSVYEAGEVDGLCYIVSAHCPGGSLDDWLARRSSPAIMPADAAVKYKLMMFKKGIFFGVREEWANALGIPLASIGSDSRAPLPSDVEFPGEFIKNDPAGKRKIDSIIALFP